MGVGKIPCALLLALTLAACGGNGGGVISECGDGAVEGAEQCDDGNGRSCDGCSASCLAETGWICGDGEQNASCGEQCDDGNTVSDDGCDAECRLEGCGNGRPEEGEECDDGNTDSCDGCSSSCVVETGWVCGDAEQNASCGEQCDDGNTDPCDGCSPTCVVETGWVCGDGESNASCGEQCDDGNTTTGDGCDAECQIELNGEYAVTISVSDMCDFDSGTANAPMWVEEKSETSVIVDIPFGGAGGECNPQTFERVDNTLTWTRSFEQTIDECTLQRDIVTVLTIDVNPDVTGYETEMRSALAGDCTGLNLPCTREFDLIGARCDGCFDCAQPVDPTTRAGTGPLGTASGQAGVGSALGRSRPGS